MAEGVDVDNAQMTEFFQRYPADFANLLEGETACVCPAKAPIADRDLAPVRFRHLSVSHGLYY